MGSACFDGAMDLEIRPGAVADLGALAPLWTSMVDHHREVAGGGVPVRAAADAWTMRRREYEAWLTDGSGFLLVARCGGGPTGYVVGRCVGSGPTFDLGPVRGEVESLVVAPEARGSGVGTALLEACRDAFRRRACTYWAVSVMEANDGAVQLYERAGFRPWLRELVGRLDDEPDDEPDDEAEEDAAEPAR